MFIINIPSPPSLLIDIFLLRSVIRTQRNSIFLPHIHLSLVRDVCLSEHYGAHVPNQKNVWSPYTTFGSIVIDLANNIITEAISFVTFTLAHDRHSID